jgi:hypothetical protein
VKSPFLRAVLSLFAASCPLANANILIKPTFENSITWNPMAQKIETGIDQAISNIESFIANPITVSIDFENRNNGLGQSSTLVQDLSYSRYRSDLADNQELSSNDKLALASLPKASNNPVNGNADVVLTLPNLRAIGETAPNFSLSLKIILCDLRDLRVSQFPHFRRQRLEPSLTDVIRHGRDAMQARGCRES